MKFVLTGVTSLFGCCLCGSEAEKKFGNHWSVPARARTFSRIVHFSHATIVQTKSSTFFFAAGSWFLCCGWLMSSASGQSLREQPQGWPRTEANRHTHTRTHARARTGALLHVKHRGLLNLRAAGWEGPTSQIIQTKHHSWQFSWRHNGNDGINGEPLQF